MFLNGFEISIIIKTQKKKVFSKANLIWKWSINYWHENDKSVPPIFGKGSITLRKFSKLDYFKPSGPEIATRKKRGDSSS